MNYPLNFILIGIWVKPIQVKDLLMIKKKYLMINWFFLKVISNVIRSGMNIVGVNTPEKM